MADTERTEVIYTDGGGRSGGATAAIVVGILAVIVVLFLVFGRGLLNGGGTKDINADVHIDTPASGGATG